MLVGRRFAGTLDMSLPVYGDDARGRHIEAGQKPQQGGLAAAGGPKQREELALARFRERHVIDGNHSAEVRRTSWRGM